MFTINQKKFKIQNKVLMVIVKLQKFSRFKLRFLLNLFPFPPRIPYDIVLDLSLNHEKIFCFNTNKKALFFSNLAELSRIGVLHDSV